MRVGRGVAPGFDRKTACAVETRRTSAKVADDDGVISVETALRDYGVVVSAKGAVDEAATTRTRVGRSA